MLKPLEQWICDVCGEVIESVDKGYVVWKDNREQRRHSFRVIHQSICDLDNSFSSSSALEDFIGIEGLNKMLSWLSLGMLKNYADEGGAVGDFNEYVDFVRRMQTPYYEEARTFFSSESIQQDFCDANEIYPYQVEVLKRIVETGLEEL